MTGAPIKRCPICGEPETIAALESVYDDRYGYPGLFKLRHCRRCNHRYLDAQFTSAELEILYTEYYPRRELDVARWRPHPEFGRVRTSLGRHRSSAFRWVPPRVRVLDIGCGLGESLGYHRSRGSEAVGVDADANLGRVADHYGLSAKVGLFNVADFTPGEFDYVTLDQVIEHVADSVAVLRDAASLVKPGGRLVLATPNGASMLARALGSRWAHVHAPYHLQLFSRQSLRELAQQAGLRVLLLRNITPPQWYGFQWLHLLGRGEPGAASPFWSRRAAWPRGVIPIRKFISALGRVGLNHLLAYALDGLRQGDNLVAVLERPRD